jgi:PhnB protein
MLMRFKEGPEGAAVPPGSGEKVMHASFRVGDAIINASDGSCAGTPKFQGFAIALRVADAVEAERVFAALGEGGQVQMPLTQTFFSPRFGMVADRFGVSWMVLVGIQA